MRKFLFFLLLPSLGLAQSAAVLKVREHRKQNENVLLDAYRSFLSIPNVAADMDNIKRNADWIMEYMKASGIEHVQLLQPVTPNKPPAVYGEV
ncbi:MAG: hypothetical protein RLZZ64_1184, partial [Bacteroidota bacterium]